MKEPMRAGAGRGLRRATSRSRAPWAVAAIVGAAAMMAPTTAVAAATSAPAARGSLAATYPQISIYGTARVPGQVAAWAVGSDTTSSSITKGIIYKASAQSWKSVPLPSIAGSATYLSSVTASSSTDAWAAGWAHYSGADHGLLLHWNGTAWRQATIATPAAMGKISALGNITSTGKDTFVAFVTASTSPNHYHQRLVAFNGKKWSDISPTGLPPSPLIDSLAASSPKNIWAVSAYFKSGSNNPVDVTYVYNGRWRTVTMPKSLSLVTDVSALASNDVWVAGENGGPLSPKTYPVAAHYNGSSWTVQRQPSSAQGTVLGIGGLSGTDAFGIGAYMTGGVIFQRYNGSSARTVSTAWPSHLGNGLVVSSLVVHSPSRMWAIATAWSGTPYSSTQYTYGLYYNGTKWVSTKL